MDLRARPGRAHDRNKYSSRAICNMLSWFKAVDRMTRLEWIPLPLKLPISLPRGDVFGVETSTSRTDMLCCGPLSLNGIMLPSRDSAIAHCPMSLTYIEASQWWSNLLSTLKCTSHVRLVLRAYLAWNRHSHPWHFYLRTDRSGFKFLVSDCWLESIAFERKNSGMDAKVERQLARTTEIKSSAKSCSRVESDKIPRHPHFLWYLLISRFFLISTIK